MRYNGELQYLTTTGAGVSDYGEPIAGTTEWSDTYLCSVRTRSDNRNRNSGDGTERVASFDILLDLTSGYPWEERARIKLARAGESLGEFEVISAELMPTVGRIKITV